MLNFISRNNPKNISIHSCEKMYNSHFPPIRIGHVLWKYSLSNPGNFCSEHSPNSACSLFALKIFKFPIYSASRVYLHKYTRFDRSVRLDEKDDYEERFSIRRRMPWHQMRPNTFSIIHLVDFKIHLISLKLFPYVHKRAFGETNQPSTDTECYAFIRCLSFKVMVRKLISRFYKVI